MISTSLLSMNVYIYICMELLNVLSYAYILKLMKIVISKSKEALGWY